PELSRRLHVPARHRRARAFEITNCDLKRRAADGIHPTRSRNKALPCPRAIAVNIEIMRVFVKLRQVMASHVHLARRLDEVERRYDTQFRVAFDTIRQLMIPPRRESRRVRFRSDE